MSKKLKYLFFLLFIFAINCKSQQNKTLDSLKEVLKNHAEDTIGLKSLVALSEICDEDSIVNYTVPGHKLLEELMIRYPEKNKYLSLLQTEMYINDAYFLEYKGDIKGAIKANMNSMAILEKFKDPRRLSVTLNNIATLYLDELNFKNALEYYHRSLSIQKKLKDPLMIANASGNIGSVYYKSGNYDSALYYYRITESLITLSTAPSLLGSVTNNIGTVYSKLNKLDTALIFLNKALAIWEQYDKKRVPVCMINIGDIYLRRNDAKTAINMGEKAFAIALQTGRPSDISETANLLKNAYFKENNFEKALYYFEEFKKLKDSLVNDEAKQALTRAQMQYEYDKKTAINKIRQQKKDALGDEEQQQQRIIIYSISGGLFLLLLLSGFILRGYRQKQKSHTEISKQKEIIEEKQKEIIDSIRYAKRIQQSLMPTEKYISQKINKL